MLRNIGDMAGYSIEARDGLIGHVRDFYFDDAAWVLRYFVVDTGVWLASRNVLISPIGMGPPDDLVKAVPVSLTQAQVRNSPDLDTARPVSRQHEKRFMAFYAYAPYWGGTGLWGKGDDPSQLLRSIDPMTMKRLERDAELDGSRPGGEETVSDPHLRSFATVITYRLQAGDGQVGHLRGLLVDDSTWAIRYLVVDTGHWWLGHQVLVSPTWAEEINWFEGTISLALSRNQVKEAPRYDPRLLLERAQEQALHRHYGRSGYWSNEADREPANPSR